MSKWSDRTDERDIYRALVVQSHGPAGVDALDYLAAQSRADDGRDTTRQTITDGGTTTDVVRIDGVREDGRPRVERKRVVRSGSSVRAEHARLPPECAVLVSGDGTPVGDLTADERAWVDAETEAR